MRDTKAPLLTDEHYEVREALTGKIIPNKAVRYIMRIDNDGMSVLPAKCDRPGKFEKEVFVSRLSITYDTWIAIGGMSTYVAKLIDKPAKPSSPEADRSRLEDENRLLREALGEARRFVENDRMDSLTSHRDAWAAAARKCVLRIDALLTPARTEPGSVEGVAGNTPPLTTPLADRSVVPDGTDQGASIANAPTCEPVCPCGISYEACAMDDCPCASLY